MNGQHNKKEGILFRHLFLFFTHGSILFIVEEFIAREYTLSFPNRF